MTGGGPGPSGPGGWEIYEVGGRQLFANNLAVELAAAAGAEDASLALERGTDLPEISGGDWMLLTLEGGGGLEIVRATAHVPGSGVCAVARAQEGTAALPWPAGTRAENRATAATFKALAPLAALAGAVTDAALVKIVDPSPMTCLRFTRMSGNYFDVELP